jgi:hypothetical protein
MKVIPEAKRERGERRPLYFKPRSFRQRPQVVESRGRIGQLPKTDAHAVGLFHALFLDVMTEKADQRCSTF